MGLVDRLAPAESVLEDAAELADSIAANAPLAVRAVKRALRGESRLRRLKTRVAPSMRSERALDNTNDYEEGLAAFAERRSPRFTGR